MLLEQEKREAAAVVLFPVRDSGSGRRTHGGPGYPVLLAAAAVISAAIMVLYLSVSGMAAVGPQGSYTELAGTDKVELCTSLGGAPAYACNGPTTSFPIGSTVFVRIETNRVANTGLTNSLRLLNYAGSTIRTSTFTTQTTTPPYIYTGSILTSGASYLKVTGNIRSWAGTRFVFEEDLESLINQYIRFYRDGIQTTEAYTFKPSTATQTSYVYVTAYGTGQIADSTNNFARLNKFNNTSFGSINPGTVNPGPGNLYNFTYTMPQLGGNLVDGDWYWMATRLRRSTGATVEQMSRMIQVDGSNPTAAIDLPAAGTYVQATVPVTGTAADLYSFDYWVLEGGAGASPVSWSQIGSGTAPVSAGTLANWDTTSAADGQYSLRLTVVDRAGNTSQDLHTVNVDNNPPVISGINITGITSTVATVNWSTNEAADSYIEYDIDPGVPYTSSAADLSMVTGHSLPLAGLSPNTTYYYRVRSTDAAGHSTLSSEGSFTTASVMVLQPFPAAGKDAGIESGQPVYNHGSEAYLRTADTPSLGTTRSNIRFDLAQIPAGSIIVSATMSLYQMGQGDTGTPTLNLHALARNWAEGTGSGSATGDGATWMTYDGVNSWTAPGGDFNPVASASASGAATIGAWVDWNATAQTQAWVNSATSNYGAIIKQDIENPAGNDIKTFYSSDFTGDASLRPKLVIEWLGSDATGPQIDEVRVEGINQTGATIKWSTDENSNSRVEYGTTTSYGSMSPLDPALVNQHSVTLSTLTADTVYHFRVRSMDPAGNETISGDYVFQTARVIVIQPSPIKGADTWLDAAQTANNYGAATDLAAGDNGAAGARRALLKFDLSQIPAGSTINSATLSLYQHAQADASTPELGVYAVSRSWLEGSGQGTATGDGATWSSYDGVNSWTAPGGDFGAAECLATAPNSSGAWFELTCMTGLVQKWVSGTQTNFGLIVKKSAENPAPTDYKTFYSSDYATDTSLRPKLTIEFVPAPGSMAMSIDETWNRDASFGNGSVGFGNVSTGSTYFVGNGGTPAYAVMLTIWSNTNWGLKLLAFDDLKQADPTNFISISNLAWEDSDNPGGYLPMVKSPAETLIASAMPPTGGTTYRFDYRLTLPPLAVSGSYSVPVIYTAFPS